MEEPALLCFEAPIIGAHRIAHAEVKRRRCGQDG
jgi:hypothetical protein